MSLSGTYTKDAIKMAIDSAINKKLAHAEQKEYKTIMDMKRWLYAEFGFSLYRTGDPKEEER